MAAAGEKHMAIDNAKAKANPTPAGPALRRAGVTTEVAPKATALDQVARLYVEPIDEFALLTSSSSADSRPPSSHLRAAVCHTSDRPILAGRARR
jgi:hypothetical protein